MCEAVNEAVYKLWCIKGNEDEKKYADAGYSRQTPRRWYITCEESEITWKWNHVRYLPASG